MDTREQVLLVILVLLLGVAGYYYGGNILPSASGLFPESLGKTLNPVLRYVGLGSEPEPDVKAPKLKKLSLNNHRQSLLDAVNLNSVKWSQLDSAQGLTGEFRLNMNIENAGSSRYSSFGGTFSGQLFSPGLIDGRLRIREPKEFQFKEFVLRSRSEGVFVSNPDFGKKMLRNAFQFPRSPYGWGLTQLNNFEAVSREEVEMNGNKFFRVNLKNDDSTVTVRVTRNKPYRLLMVDHSGNPSWKWTINYQDRKAGKLQSITVSRAGEVAKELTVSDGSLKLVVQPVDPVIVSHYRFSLKGEPGALNVKMEFRSQNENQYNQLGSGTVNLNNGQPSDLDVDLNILDSPDNPIDMTANLVSNNLSYHQSFDPSSLSGQNQFEQTNMGQVFTELMMKPDTSPEDSESTDTAAGNDQSMQQTRSDMKQSSRNKKQRRQMERTRGRDGTSSAQEGNNTERKTRRSETDMSPPSKVEQNRPSSESGDRVDTSGVESFPRSSPPDGFAEVKNYYQQGKIEKTLESLQTLSDTYPESMNVNYLLGMVHYELGHPEKARDAFEKVLEYRHDPQLRGWSLQYLEAMEAED